MAGLHLLCKVYNDNIWRVGVAQETVSVYLYLSMGKSQVQLYRQTLLYHQPLLLRGAYLSLTAPPDSPRATWPLNTNLLPCPRPSTMEREARPVSICPCPSPACPCFCAAKMPMKGGGVGEEDRQQSVSVLRGWADPAPDADPSLPYPIPAAPAHPQPS